MAKHMLRVAPYPWSNPPRDLIFQCEKCRRYITIARTNVFDLVVNKSDFLIKEQRAAQPLSYEEWTMCWVSLEKEVSNGEAHA